MSPAAATTASHTLTSAYALTTTFTAPPQCAQSVGGLTILKNDGFRIWLNAPLPVPGTTISSCYADQFISSFLLEKGGISQAPFSGLICPAGYTTQGPFTSNYIACCPSGWDGFAPASNAPSDRPAFGGTCYTNIFNVPIQVTSYDDASIKASSIFTATNSADQAFALPYEGYALGVAILASTTSKSSQATSTSHSGSSPLGASDTASGKLSPGSLAGVIIGSIIAVLLLVGLVVLALNYRHKRLTDRKGQSQFYNSRSGFTDSPTPMMFMDEGSPSHAGFYAGKQADRGTVTRSREEERQMTAQELDGSRRKTVYEMEAGTAPMIKTKGLPDLPMRSP